MSGWKCSEFTNAPDKINRIENVLILNLSDLNQGRSRRPGDLWLIAVSRAFPPSSRCLPRSTSCLSFPPLAPACFASSNV